jgi:hypothetical protein
MFLEPGLDLTYCTNIHPGNGWKEVSANIARYAPALKQRLSPDAPFALGLRISDEESRQLLQGETLGEFAGYLARNGLYVSLINGFVFGTFYRERIKENAFAPDWQTDARLEYTLRLCRVLSRLLPEGGDGGVSTVPLSYKRNRLHDAAAWRTMARNIAAVAVALARIHRAENKFIHLDIEPEPDGLVENSAELTSFFLNWLLPEGSAVVAAELGCSVDEARAILLEYVRVCFDTCHSAVEFETVDGALDRYEAAGIRIGRVQISSALRVTLNGFDRQRTARELEPFAESTYLHQVIESQRDGTRRQYGDLTDALPHIENAGAREWRIHFHVPVFVESYGMFDSTQMQIRATLDRMKRQRFTPHLEIETYTWEVLPEAMKQDLGDMIAREYGWVLDAWR